MLPPRLIREVLALNAQEGGVGLYEVIWDLNTRVPTADPSVTIHASIPVLVEFITRGWVELYMECWATRLERPVSRASALSVAADPLSWAPPSDEATWYYCYVITEAGQRAHARGLLS
jgi:hypothetical protein